MKFSRHRVGFFLTQSLHMGEPYEVQEVEKQKGGM